MSGFLTRESTRLLGYLLLAVGAGAVGGLVWWLIVDLPVYHLDDMKRANTTERALAEFIGGDGWFCAIGIVVGLALGILGWRSFRRLGWPVALAVVGAAGVAAVVCWGVGYELGPDDFYERVASAGAGADVAIQLTLRARASLLVWPFFAVIPVLVGSSLGHDDEDPVPTPEPVGVTAGQSGRRGPWWRGRGR